MHQRIPKKNQPLPGVKCMVNTCYYHGQGNYCNAAKIEIQPKNAQNIDETDCATFTPNSH